MAGPLRSRDDDRRGASRLRTIFAALMAFIAATLVPAAAFAVMNPFVVGAKSVFLWMLVFLAYAAFPALIVAVPAFLVLLRFRRVRWWSMVAVGAIAGALVSMTLYGERMSAAADDVLAAAAIGAAGGGIFWLVWVMCGGERSGRASR